MNQINIPSGWNEVLVDQFLYFMKTRETSDSFLVFEDYVQLLAALTDTLPTDDIWEDMDIDELLAEVKKISWAKISPTDKFSKQFGEFTIKPVETISLGEFIDLDHLFTNGYFENFTKIAGIFLRRTKENEWGSIIYEPHGSYNYEERGESILESPITNFYGLIKYFLDFKALINSNYEPLFEPVIIDGDNEDEQDEYDPEEQEEIKREETFKKWAWESVLHKLSDGDITKYDRITELPVIFIFNQLGFRKEMDL